MIFLNLFLINLLSTTADKNAVGDYCDKDAKDCPSTPATTNSDEKLLFYDVNPAEGFNLRRDVYMRFALMLEKGKQRGRNWSLVLPPWHKLYHWKSAESNSRPKFWSEFFDVTSLKEYPVIEMHEAFELNKGKPLLIDTLYVLMNFENPFENGVFEEKYQLTTGCSYNGNFWGYNNVTVLETVCIRFQGKISKLWELIYHHPYDKRVMFMHGEIPLHDDYGSKSYWKCRKSMKFNKKLIKTAKKYIEDKLDCETDKCSTYLSVHWRRGDFSYSRPKDVPSVEGTAQQIKLAVEKNRLDIRKIFIATDADSTELKELKNKLKDSGYKVYVYKPSDSDLKNYSDGGIAIIDQIICSHATYFIGTHDSTFSFRIQEEREILGFDSNTTFNRFCPDSGPCEKSSRWTIVQ